MQFIIKSTSTPYRYTAIDTLAHTYSDSTHRTADAALANINAQAFTNSEFNDITDMDTIITNLKGYSKYVFDSFVTTIAPYEYW